MHRLSKWESLQAHGSSSSSLHFRMLASSGKNEQVLYEDENDYFHLWKHKISHVSFMAITRIGLHQEWSWKKVGRSGSKCKQNVKQK